MPTSLRAIAEKASTTGPGRKRTVLKSPVRENCTPGSVRGRSGNWPFYLDGHFTPMFAPEPNKQKRDCSLPPDCKDLIDAIRFQPKKVSISLPPITRRVTLPEIVSVRYLSKLLGFDIS